MPAFSRFKRYVSRMAQKTASLSPSQWIAYIIVGATLAVLLYMCLFSNTNETFNLQTSRGPQCNAHSWLVQDMFKEKNGNEDTDMNCVHEYVRPAYFDKGITLQNGLEDLVYCQDGQYSGSGNGQTSPACTKTKSVQGVVTDFKEHVNQQMTILKDNESLLQKKYNELVKPSRNSMVYVLGDDTQRQCIHNVRYGYLYAPQKNTLYKLSNATLPNKLLIQRITEATYSVHHMRDPNTPKNESGAMDVTDYMRTCLKKCSEDNRRYCLIKSNYAKLDELPVGYAHFYKKQSNVFKQIAKNNSLEYKRKVFSLKTQYKQEVQSSLNKNHSIHRPGYSTLEDKETASARTLDNTEIIREFKANLSLKITANGKSAFVRIYWKKVSIYIEVPETIKAFRKLFTEPVTCQDLFCQKSVKMADYLDSEEGVCFMNKQEGEDALRALSSIQNGACANSANFKSGICNTDG